MKTIQYFVLCICIAHCCRAAGDVLSQSLPLCVVTQELRIPNYLQEYKPVFARLLSEFAREEGTAENPLQLKDRWTIEGFEQALGMPTFGCNTLTVYEFSLHAVKEPEGILTRIVLRFVPGDHSTRTFAGAVQQNLKDSVEAVEKNSKKDEYAAWVKALFLSDTYMNYVPCGLVVFDLRDGKPVLAPRATQAEYLQLRAVKIQ